MIDLAIPIIWVPDPYPDPWNGVIRFPSEDPIAIPLDRLEVGPSLVVAPSLEFTFRSAERVRPTVFFGAGFMSDDGQSTSVDGHGSFRTTSSTSPVLTYGGAVSISLSNQTSLRLEGRLLTAFMDSMTVVAPDGDRMVAEGDTITSGFVSVGVDFSF